MQAHIYSLGATLKAAIEYIAEPETESEFGQDLHTLLEQMQEENPENRPDIEVKRSYINFCFKKSDTNISVCVLINLFISLISVIIKMVLISSMPRFCKKAEVFPNSAEIQPFSHSTGYTTWKVDVDVRQSLDF